MPAKNLMFLSTYKKIIGVWTFEVSCIKWMEKSEVIQIGDINH